MRTCPGCLVQKQFSEFSKSSSRPNGLDTYCRQCKKDRHLKNRDVRLAQMLKYRQENLEKRRAADSRYYASNREQVHGRMLQRTYGITRANYDAMLEQQGGVCCICRGPAGKKRFAVDHCHTTGKVRGLLCMNCNPGLGKFLDSPELLRAAAAYLETHKS